MIKAKDPRLALIDVAIPRFLTKSPPSGTQDAQLPAPLVAKLLYSHKQPLPSDDEQEWATPGPTQKDIDKDFEVFYRADFKDSLAPIHCPLVATQVSTSQEITNVPKAMVLQEKTLDLLALLTAYTRGDAPVVPIIPRPPTSAPLLTSPLLMPPRRKERGERK